MYTGKNMGAYPYTSRWYATEKARAELPVEPLSFDWTPTPAPPIVINAVPTNGGLPELAKRKHNMEIAILKFNSIYQGAPTRTNLGLLENKYREIINLYTDLLTEERRQHLTIKVNAFQSKVRAAEAGAPPAEEIPGMPPTVKIGAFEISTKTLMYILGAAGVVAFVATQKKRR